MFRAAQEALRNVVAHAGADRVDVDVLRENGARRAHGQPTTAAASPPSAARAEGHLGLRAARRPRRRRGRPPRHRQRARAAARGSAWRCRAMIRVLLADDHARRARRPRAAARARGRHRGRRRRRRRRRGRRSSPPSTRPTSCSWTSRCPAWTASRRRGASREAAPARASSCSPRSPTASASSARSTPAPSATCSRTPSPTSCCAAIRAAARGESPLTPQAARAVLAARARAARPALTEREREVLELVARGPAQQAHRAPARDQREDGQGAPDRAYSARSA